MVGPPDEFSGAPPAPGAPGAPGKPPGIPPGIPPMEKKCKKYIYSNVVLCQYLVQTYLAYQLLELLLHFDKVLS